MIFPIPKGLRWRWKALRIVLAFIVALTTFAVLCLALQGSGL